MQRVGVTGIGIVSSIGKNIRQFRASLRNGHCGVDRIKKKTDAFTSVKIGAEINDFSFESIIENENVLSDDMIQRVKQSTRRSPFPIQVAAISAMEAWKHACLHEEIGCAERIGIIVAGSNFSQHYAYRLYPGFQQNPEYLTPKYPLHYMDTDHVGTLSEIFAIHGEGFTVGGASASGNVAIIKGCQLIQLGMVDVCLIIGALADLSPMELQGFYNIGAMGGKQFRDDPKKACRPFDKGHEGFIYGQASGCLVLESVEFAMNRGVDMVAEILGGAIVLDGNRLADPNEDGEIRAMLSALRNARIDPDQVDYLNAHGTSSPLGDKVEVKAIKNVFKDSLSRLWINSTKGLTGHCLQSAGVIESIAAMIQMQENFVHPNKNLEDPIDAECQFCRDKSIHTPIHISMSNSFGFGGINTSLILKQGDR